MSHRVKSLRPSVLAAVLVAAVSGVAGCRAIERGIQKLDELEKQIGTPRGQMLAKHDETKALRRQLTDALMGGPPIRESEGRASATASCSWRATSRARSTSSAAGPGSSTSTAAT